MRTNSLKIIMEGLVNSFDAKTDHRLLFRRLGVYAADVVPDVGMYQMNLFTDYEALEREKRMQGATVEIRRRFGANSLIKGMNLMKGATARERNEQIGGHKR